MQADVPSWEKVLHQKKESFLLCSQDPAAYQNVILQLTDCTINVPIVELQPEKEEEERKKIATPEGICYSLMNSYMRTYHVYTNDTTRYDYNVTNGYKPKYIFLYWLDHTHESDEVTNINNFVLERPSLKNLNIWLDDYHLTSYEPKNGAAEIDWDQIYQDFIEWTGRSISTKEIRLHSRTIIQIKIDPNPQSQVKNPDLFTPWETGQINIRRVFETPASSRQLRLCIQSERLMFNNTKVILKSWTQIK